MFLTNGTFFDQACIWMIDVCPLFFVRVEKQHKMRPRRICEKICEIYMMFLCFMHTKPLHIQQLTGKDGTSNASCKTLVVGVNGTSTNFTCIPCKVSLLNSDAIYMIAVIRDLYIKNRRWNVGTLFNVLQLCSPAR